MPEIIYQGERIQNLPTLKAQALLYYLVIHHQISQKNLIAKEELTDIFWPGMPLSSALQNLRQTIYQLRKVLPEISENEGESTSLIQSDRKTVCIYPHAFISTDLDFLFRETIPIDDLTIPHCEQIIQEYRGQFLENFYVPMCPAFEEWITKWREDIQSRIIKVLQKLARHYVDTSEPLKAKKYALKLIELDPYAEQSNLIYLQALRDLGERNKALQAYQVYESLLLAELEVEPGSHIKTLYEGLKAIPSHNHIPSSLDVPKSRSPKKVNFTATPQFLAGIGVGVLSLALILGLLFRNPNPRIDASNIRIAVLPFENHTTREYLAEGLTDDIIVKLSKVKGISVISRQSSSQYHDTQKPLKVIGNELQVPYLIKGSLQEIDEQFKLTIQFLEASTGELRWAETFVRPKREIFAFQNAISQEVVTNLQTTFELEPNSDFVSLTTSHPEAYNLYLQGRYRFYQAHPQALHQAIELFKKALALDTEFHLARAWLAWTYCSLAGSWGDENAEDMYPKVQEELAKIAGITELEGMYFKVLGWMNLWLLDQVKAEKYLRNAAEIDYNGEFGLSGLAMVLTLRRNFEEAQSVAKKGLNTNPHFFWNYFGLAQAYFYDREFDRAGAVIDTALQLFANHQASICIKGSIYTFQGEPQKAISYLTQELNRLGTRSASILGDLGVAYAAAGDESLALSLASELIARHQQGEKYTGYFAAKIYAMLGENVEALKLLEESLARRDNELNWIEVDFEFKSIRSNPRYQDIIEKLGINGVEM